MKENGTSVLQFLWGDVELKYEKKAWHSDNATYELLG
jgi:hypothetical protein